jgi:hypothetical protein
MDTEIILKNKVILLEEITPNIACNISGDTQNRDMTVCLEDEILLVTI